MSTEVIAELYDFLKENETGLYKNYKTDEVIGYVHISFYDLKNFVDIVGEDEFVEGGINVQMFNNSICVEINDIIEGYGHELSDYKNCFDESDWDYYCR